VAVCGGGVAAVGGQHRKEGLLDRTHGDVHCVTVRIGADAGLTSH
jgi:hypothetical protein